MASPLQRAVSRALQSGTGGGPAYKKTFRPSLGNLKGQMGGSGSGKNPAVGTLAVQFQSPGMPLAFDQDAMDFETQAYAQNIFVMRCIQTIATTIAGLPFKAGSDPFDPGQYDPVAPLAQLLGPATPQAPGGPNPNASSRWLWDWTIKQYAIYGRWAWETQIAKTLVPGARRRTQDSVVALWPLPAPYIAPIPTDGSQEYFDGYKYTISRGERTLENDQIFYAWKPRHDDIRQPESVLDAARRTIDISIGLDKYMTNLLQNDMVATTMIVTPPFAEKAGRRAFRQQFRARYTGVDQAGGTIFGEAHRATGDTTGNPLMQVEKIAQTAIEASLIQISAQAKIDITVALGVPMSLIGNASQRTYANADSEYKNFWTITILPMIADIQDYINTMLAPRIGMEVGWFDLSKVAALKPPAIFTPPMVGDAINFGIADAPTVANLLGIPAANASADSDTDTVDVGVESATSTSLGGRSERAEDQRVLYNITKDQLINAYIRYEQRPLNTTNIDTQFSEVAGRYIQREVVHLRKPKDREPVDVRSPEAVVLEARMEKIRQRRAKAERENRAIRAAAIAERAEMLAEGSRAWINQLRAEGREGEALDLEEFLAEQAEDLLIERRDPDTFDQADALTTWDNSPETFDAWVDENSPVLEALADG